MSFKDIKIIIFTVCFVFLILQGGPRETKPFVVLRIGHGACNRDSARKKHFSKSSRNVGWIGPNSSVKQQRSHKRNEHHILAASRCPFPPFTSIFFCVVFFGVGVVFFFVFCFFLFFCFCDPLRVGRVRIGVSILFFLYFDLKKPSL